MQSVDLSYARYVYYLSQGIVIDYSNCYLLFIDKDNFLRNFGKENDEVRKEYSYRVLRRKK